MKFFQYYGSKTYLLEDIYKVVSAVKNKITCFVDVFGGSGVVALNLPWKFSVIVYNDLDEYLYKTFKVIQDENLRKQLVEKLELAFSHRRVFDEFKQDYLKNNTNLSDVEIAFRVIYLTSNSFNGDIKSFGIMIAEKKNRISHYAKAIKNFGSLIKDWIIENLDFREVMRKYDSPTTFFYLDPPYLGSGEHYKFGSWGIGAFKEMKKLLDEIKGYWLLNESEVDFEEIIKIFGEPKLVKEYANYALNKEQIEKTGGRTIRKEGFWCNFPIEKEAKLQKFW